jgi:flagellar basal-body rod protein FlgB
LTHVLESATRHLLAAALDATAARQMAVSHNIANAATPGYRAVEVDFHAHMERVVQSGAGARRGEAVRVQPMLEEMAPDALGSRAVSLENEVAKMSELTLRQQVLLKALNRHFSTLAAAIAPEGRK